MLESDIHHITSFETFNLINVEQQWSTVINSHNLHSLVGMFVLYQARIEKQNSINLICRWWVYRVQFWSNKFVEQRHISQVCLVNVAFKCCSQWKHTAVALKLVAIINYIQGTLYFVFCILTDLFLATDTAACSGCYSVQAKGLNIM